MSMPWNYLFRHTPAYLTHQVEDDQAQHFIDVIQNYPDEYPNGSQLDLALTKAWLQAKGEETNWGGFTYTSSDLDALVPTP